MVTAFRQTKQSRKILVRFESTRGMDRDVAAKRVRIALNNVIQEGCVLLEAPVHDSLYKPGSDLRVRIPQPFTNSIDNLGDIREFREDEDCRLTTHLARTDCRVDCLENAFAR